MIQIGYLVMVVYLVKVEVGCVVFKIKFYEYVVVNSCLKDFFVKQVEQIIW